MVTPLRFLAVTSNPSGKCRSIFLTGGVVSSFLRMSFSSTVEGDVLIFLRGCQSRGWVTTQETTLRLTTLSVASPWRASAQSPAPLHIES
jgi:hypothetical protein